jgi:hypothetical protein
MRPAARVLPLIEAAAAQLDAAGITAENGLGQGTLSTFDEAAWLVLWALGLPLESNLQDIGQQPVAAQDAERLQGLLRQRIEQRTPTAYLTRQAWLFGVPATLQAEDVMLARLLSAFGDAFITGMLTFLMAQGLRVRYSLRRYADLANCAMFCLFSAATGVIAAVMQLAVTGRLLERFGVVSALLVLPVTLFAGLVSHIASMLSAFAAVVFTKGAENAFRYSIYDATMQVLYTPVSSQVRGRAKTFIDGIVKPVSGGLAGAAMVMIMPPYHGATIRVGEKGIYEFFRRVSDAISIPIMIQDAPVSGPTTPVRLLPE